MPGGTILSMDRYIGLMSGTSLDGIDGVLVSFGESGVAPLHVHAHAHRPFHADLRAELLALNASGANELHRAALAGNALVKSYAAVVSALLDSAEMRPRDVGAIGAHGQTVRHRPGEFDGVGYTLQLNAPALLAERCGIDVVADLRSRDVAAGGTGAPLVPAFHRAVFARSDTSVCVLNLGGIANLTILYPDGRTLGFDCGPANALMDLWSKREIGADFDANGDWAASGSVMQPLLQAMLADPYFARLPPKSTGRDLFNRNWLTALLQVHAANERPQDIQATLCELTACVCAQDIKRQAIECRNVLVCGGGALNRELMRRISAHLPGVSVIATDAMGLPATQVEACAFAWLARAFVEREPGNISTVTGARGPRILGALYPA